MTDLTLTDRFSRAHRKLESVGQAHVLQFFEQNDHAGKQQLLEQIESVDWSEVACLIKTHVEKKSVFELPEALEPAPWHPNVPPPELKDKYKQAQQLGEQLVRDNKLAVFTVAGGQGTRLGWSGPKGTFPATPITQTPLFGCFAAYLRKIHEKFAATIPWYIMTSPVNHASVCAFFEQNNYFGLDQAHISMFPQQMMPAVEKTSGKVLLETPGSLALSPNGHGGSLKALYTSGALADMKRRGIDQISYIQVDNPLVRVIDPLFIGLHAIKRAQMSSKMLPKAYPKERLGNFCLSGGRLMVIEYSDLPDELAEQRLENGELRFLAGSIAIHAICVEFAEWLNTQTGGFALPFHRAEKKVPYVDLETGQRISPNEANAVKFEMFVFDALPLCKTSIIYETDRLDEFAPIKNAQGLDSPQTSRASQIERAAHWLTSQGVHVPRDQEGQVDAHIEIRPDTAISPDDLKDVNLPNSIPLGGELLL